MMLRIFDDRISTKLNDRETGFCRNGRTWSDLMKGKKGKHILFYVHILAFISA
jgi:hypothetical protein